MNNICPQKVKLSVPSDRFSQLFSSLKDLMYPKASVFPLVSLQNVKQQQVKYIHLHYFKTALHKLRINRQLSLAGVDANINIIIVIVVIIILGLNRCLPLPFKKVPPD